MFRASAAAAAALLIGTTATAAAAPESDLTQTTFVGSSRTHGTTTVKIEDIPEDAPAHYPWSSSEDFFRYSGLSYDDMTASGIQKCSSPSPYSKVYTVSDGENERCFVAITPPGLSKAAPVLFFAHGSGGSAYQCGNQPDLTGKSWVDLALEHKFNLVCGEAVQQQSVNNITNQVLTGGIWTMPEVFNDSSGRHCTNSELENAYMEAIWSKMGSMPETFDLSKSFITGASEGAAFTQWQSVCRFESTPANYTAFATHSTGLKVKGDGNELPPCPQDPQYTWGECPTCKYWPTVVGKFDGLKACIFDNTGDPNVRDPFFYKTSEQMAQYYKAAGNRYETSYGSGGHCVMHSYEAIATCMDDGTGRLLGSSSPSGNCTDIAPDTNYTCAQQSSLGKCDRPWMNGFCCKTCFDCSATCSN